MYLCMAPVAVPLSLPQLLRIHVQIYVYVDIYIYVV